MNDVKNMNEMSEAEIERIKDQYNINDTKISLVTKLLFRCKCKSKWLSQNDRKIYFELSNYFKAGYELTIEQVTLLKVISERRTRRCNSDLNILSNRKKLTYKIKG